MKTSHQSPPAQSPVESGNPQATKPVRLVVSVWTWLTWCHGILHKVNHKAKAIVCALICASANLLNAQTEIYQAHVKGKLIAEVHIRTNEIGSPVLLVSAPYRGSESIQSISGEYVLTNFVDRARVKSLSTGTVYLTNVASHWTVATNDGIVVTAVAYRTNAPAPAGKTFEPVFLAGLQGSSNIITITVSTNSDGNPVLEDICQNVTLVNFVNKGRSVARDSIIEKHGTQSVGRGLYKISDFARSTNSLPAPLMQTDPMYGTQPNASEIALQWEANPDCERYVVEYLSARTTNQWLKAGTFRPTPGLSFVNASIFVDLDVPCWTRVIGITESGDRTPPTEPLRHPALSSPRPMTQHKQMFVRPTRALTATEMHRNRMEPMPVIPQPPVP